MQNFRGITVWGHIALGANICEADLNAFSSLLPIRRFQKLNPALLRRKAPVLANLFNWNRKRPVFIPYFENRLPTADLYYPVLFLISLDKTLASGSFVSFIAREEEFFPLRSKDGQKLPLVIGTHGLNQGLDRTFWGHEGLLLFFVRIAWPYRGAGDHTYSCRYAAAKPNRYQKCHQTGG